MKIYDSAFPFFTATAVGTVVTLQPNPQGSAVPDKPLAVSNAHLVVSPGTPVRVQDAVNTEVFDWSNMPLTKLQWGGPYGHAPLNVTLNGVVATDSITIDGVVYAAVASGATGTQFNVGVSDTATATNLAAAINAKLASLPGAWFITSARRLLFTAGLSGTGTISGTADIQASIDGLNIRSLASSPPMFSLSGTNAATAGNADDQPAYQLVRALPASLTGTNVRLQVFMEEVHK